MSLKKLLVLVLCLVGCGALPLTYAQNLTVSNLIYPSTSQLSCGVLPFSDSLVVRVTNAGAAAASNFDISVSVDGGSPVTENYTGSLAPGGFVNYKFSNNLQLNSQGYHTIKVYTSLPVDLNRLNDTLQFVYMSRIKNFPYYEDFEANNGGFAASGTNSTWKWGTPNKNLMKPAEGNSSWFNGVTSAPYYYLASDFSVLQFPCYDFTDLKSPYVAFKLFVEVENGWESVTMEYSINNGASWNVLGSGGPNDCNRQNWYNSGSTWGGNSMSYPCGSWGGGCTNGICGRWIDVKHCMNNLAGQPSVTFRLRFASSGTQCQAEGVGIDSVVIDNSPTPVFDFALPSACAGAPAAFVATTPSNCITAYSWDFGDNSPRFQVKNAAHIFPDSGTYAVKLFVTSSCGKVDSLVKNVYIRPRPPVDLSAIAVRYCISATPVTLQANPAGGKFYHGGQVVTSVDPAAWGLGKDTIIYEYTGVNGCTSYDTLEIEIYQPQVDIDNLGGNYCQFAADFKLRGIPAGGSFLINSVQDSIFSPSSLGLGTHTVTYIYADSVNCSNSITRSVVVSNNLVVDILNLDSAYCATVPAFPLTGTPFGGVFYINGVQRNNFDPSLLGAGTQDTVVYHYTDGTCANSDTQYVKIIDVLPVIQGLKSLYCYNETAVTLSATPTGGIFAIDGITRTQLNPVQLTAGNHRVVYFYQDPVYGCADSAVHLFVVEKPVVSVQGLLPDYCINGAKETLTGIPAGGVFEINGSPASEIDPAILGLGQHTVKYTFKSANGCEVSVTHNFRIRDKPQLQLTGFNKSVCFNSPEFPLQANPSGGAFTLDGLPVQKIDPSVLTLHVPHLVTYTYVDFQYGCINSITDTVTVNIPPSISIVGTEDEYCTTDEEVLLSATPAGGTFEINGVVAAVFDPKLLGAGNYVLTYEYQDASGCKNSLQKPITVTGNPGDTISPGPIVELCAGEEIVFQVNGSLPGIWSTNETSATIRVKPAQTTDYWYKVLACVNYVDSVKVIIHGNPKADFVLDPSTGFSPLSTRITNTSSARLEKWGIDGQDYTTDPLDHVFQSPGVFDVMQVVIDSNGCRDTLVKSVSVFDGITIPNVFSPNTDGTNDNFGPITQGAFEQYEFKVFNRWGNQLFSATTPYERWDGTHNGNPVPEGVYYYVLKAKNIKEFELTGSVTLVR